MNERRFLRVATAFIAATLIAVGSIYSSSHKSNTTSTLGQSTTKSQPTGQAADVLAQLPIKGRAPKTGYSRAQFGGTWADAGGCDMREKILGRDLTNVQYRSATDCTVLSGTLNDPYTGRVINFVRGPGTSDAVQIDHVVAIGDAWQKGAQQLPQATREQLYNDPLELLAVDGNANQQKGDGDAATWLPPNKDFRCRYVARQIAVKVKYHLWATQAEHDAMARVLSTCPGQQLPIVSQ